MEHRASFRFFSSLRLDVHAQRIGMCQCYGPPLSLFALYILTHHTNLSISEAIDLDVGVSRRKHPDQLKRDTTELFA